MLRRVAPFIFLMVFSSPHFTAASPAPGDRIAGAPAAEGIWEELGPPGDTQHCGVYDPARDRMVVFRQRRHNNEVWAFDFTPAPHWEWLQPTGTRPTPRIDAAAVNDPLRDRMLVIGGRGTLGTVVGTDVWAFNYGDPPAWQELIPQDTIPPDRSGHTAVYDPVGNRVLVFGGDWTSDVWELTLGDPIRWRKLVVSGTPPPRRSDHCAIYDPDHHQMVVYGGVGRTDVWRLTLDDPPTWIEVHPTAGPPATGEGWAAVFDALHHRMVISQGKTWVLTLTPGAEEWQYVAASDIRTHDEPVGIYDPLRDRLVVHGGPLIEGRDQVSALPLGGDFTWSRIDPGPLTADTPALSPIIYDPVRDRLLSVYDDRLWALGPEEGARWELLIPTGGAAPDYTSGHYEIGAPIYDPVRDRMLIFGGILYYLGATNTTYVLNLTEPRFWTQLIPMGTAPAGRWGSSAIYDPLGDRMIIFGGQDETHIYNDTWALDLATSSWEQIVTGGPTAPARSKHVGVYDPARQRMLIHGGLGSNETWALSLDGGPPTWSQLAPTGLPPSSAELSGVFDPLGDQMLVAELGSQRDLLDVYALSFDPSPNWHVIDADATPPGWNGTAAFDVSRRRMMLLPSWSTENAWSLQFDLTPFVGVPPAPPEPRADLAILSLGPNPGAGPLTVRFALPARGDVGLELFDLTGRRLLARDLGTFDPGTQVVHFDRPAGLRPGVYLVTLKSAGARVARKVAIVE